MEPFQPPKIDRQSATELSHQDDSYENYIDSAPHMSEVQDVSFDSLSNSASSEISNSSYGSNMSQVDLTFQTKPPVNTEYEFLAAQPLPARTSMYYQPQARNILAEPDLEPLKDRFSGRR